MTMNPSNSTVPDIDWFRDVVKGAPETIIFVDRACNILFHNDTAEGNDPAKLVGTPLFRYFLPEFYEMVSRKIENVFRTGQPDSYELASDYSKELRWYWTQLGPIIRDGQVVAVSLFIRNISELKRAQLALTRSKEELELRVEERTHALNEYAHRLEASEKLNAALRQAENRQEVIELLAGHCLSVLEADLVGVYEFREDKLHYCFGFGHTTPPPPVLTDEEDPLMYRLFQSNKIRHVPLSGELEPGCRFCGFIHSQHMRALLVAPLRTGETVVGVIYLGFLSPRKNATVDEQLLNGFVESGSNTLHRILVTEQLEKNIRQREHELHVLYEIMSIASEVLDYEELLKKSLSATLKAVNCRTGVIHLADPGGQKLDIAVREGYPERLHAFLTLSGESRDLWSKVYQEKQIVQARRVQTQSYHETAGPDVLVMTYLGVPIRAKDTTVGVLSIFSENEALIEPGITQLVSTIADQIGLALESTHQRQREKETLIIEERQRLARELHDSVSQSLYGLVLSADVGNKLLKLKAYSKLSETLRDIGEVALQSLKEMRLMLFELRPLSLEAVGLIGALELRLNTVERRAGMATSLEVIGNEHLPLNLDLEVYRIATEALNNSLKHARATTVKVSLIVGPEELELVIIDDGKGFDGSLKQAGGIGLSTMKERTSRIGGTLVIDSVPDTGTRIYLVVPLNKEKPLKQEAA